MEEKPTIITGSGTIPEKKNWIQRHKKLSIILGSILGVMIIGGATAAILISQYEKPALEPTPAKVVEPEPEPICYSPLTGMVIDDEKTATQQVTAVMIENSPDSRPQSGLKESGVVFEAIAEGGITRFLVLYQEQKPQLVGPVRSVRMYYVDWLAAFDASVAHIGGSAAALKEVRNGKYKDIDQFFNAEAYWRATDRYAPHNVYTNFERIDALNKKKGFTSSEFTAFPREDSEQAAEPTASKINVTISGPLYNSAYTFNKKTGTYDRSQAGAVHKDREKGTISPRVVIVMKVNEQRVFEDGWREQIHTIGSGDVHIFQDGTVTKGTWKKTARDQQITFSDSNGDPIPLARGQTWITAVPSKSGAVTWQ